MTSPDGEIPNGMYTFPVNTGENAPADVDWWADQTEADWQSKINGGFTSSFNPIGGWASGLLNALMGIFTGASTILQGISYVLGLRWNQVDTHDTAIGDLQDKTQALEGVIGYGCRYMSTGAGVQTSPATLNFDTQVGPALGVTLLSGGKYRLNSKGLWRFESQVIFNDSKWSPPRCYMDIVIKDTSGNEFARLKALAVSDAPITVTNVMPVVIPAAGYTAEVQAWTSSLPLIGAAWRTIGSGLSYTRFSVFKISSETS